MAFILYSAVLCDARASGVSLARAARLDVISLSRLAEARGILWLYGGSQ